jgi:hypothetical protein
MSHADLLLGGLKLNKGRPTDKNAEAVCTQTADLGPQSPRPGATMQPAAGAAPGQIRSN